MTRLPLFALLCSCLGIGACMPNDAQLKPYYEMRTSFDPQEVAWFDEDGTNSIQGSALIRQRGGSIVTCAGNEVDLVPVSRYATERMLVIYGSTERGYSRIGNAVIKGEPDYLYWTTSQTKRCDVQGSFSFSNLPNGSFYVITTITWRVSEYRNAGGALMARITLEDGEAGEVVLTP